MSKQPKLTLIGAGPGDVELLTIKGQKALATANVILYDALVNTLLLTLAPETAIKIFVGKRNNKHTHSQLEINKLIVRNAFEHGHVVRLKGGDPFVFGRGGEEIEYARFFGIDTCVIPGISSSIGIPAISGIPVTHRGVSESFWVITGTTKNNQLSQDIYAAAKTNATVVILMGLGKLKAITKVFSTEGKNELPVAIIQNGSLPNEKTILGSIETIAKIAEVENAQAPAIIIIGEVVQKHRNFVFENLQYDFN